MLANKALKNLLLFGSIWTLITASICQMWFAEYIVWALAFSLSFFVFLIAKWKLLSGKVKEDLKNPMMYLSLQGAFFMLALALIAIVMLGFKEDKKILLPLLLANYLIYLVFDLYQMLKQKPLS